MTTVTQHDLGVEVHRVRVELVIRERATLLTLASVLHRRGVEVLAAEMSSSEHGARFVARFRGTAAQATTVRKTLSNLVDVSHAVLEEPAALVGALR
jgi:hypothetical protein